MANVFQDKIVRYLTLSLVLFSFALLAQRFLLKKESPLPSWEMVNIEAIIQAMPKTSSVASDAQGIANLQIEKFRPFEQSINLPVKIGRTNPFEPYSTTEEIYSTSTVATSSTVVATSTVEIPTSTAATSSNP